MDAAVNGAAHLHPGQEGLQPMEGAVGQGGQGQSQVDKSMIRCLSCQEASRPNQRQYLSASNWSKHVTKIHQGTKGLRLKDWCYKGEEDQVKQRQMVNEGSQEQLRPQASSRNNTHCVVCNAYKRKASFRVTSGNGEAEYSDTCGMCTYARKRKKKVEEKIGKREEVRHHQMQQHQPSQVARPQQQVHWIVADQEARDYWSQRNQQVPPHHQGQQSKEQLEEIADMMFRLIEELEGIQIQNKQSITETLKQKYCGRHQMPKQFATQSKESWPLSSGQFDSLNAQQGEDDFVSSVLLNKRSDSFQQQLLDQSFEVQQHQVNFYESSHQFFFAPQQQQMGAITLPHLNNSGYKLDGCQQQVICQVQQSPHMQVQGHEMPEARLNNNQQIDGHSQNVGHQEEQREKELYLTAGEITQGTVDAFIDQHQDRFCELGMKKVDLVQLVSHPRVLISNGKKALHAENYYLLEPTIQAFIELVEQRGVGSNAAGIQILGVESFQQMMMYHSIGLFKDQAPTIKDDCRHIILPCYYETKSHWCFIVVDIHRQGGKHKVYMVDSARVFQKQHRKDLSNPTKQGSTWCNLVRHWIELRFKGPNKRCSFEVLDIKNQGNDFDCGLLLCLLVWQFFQTREVQDLVKFPWKREFSHHYRLAVAHAISQQELVPIEQIVQAKQEALAQPK